MKQILIIISFFILLSCSSEETIKTGESSGEVNTNINPNKYRDKFESGIDFIAHGNEPFWNIEIDFDKSVTFTSLTEIDEISVPADLNNLFEEPSKAIFKAETEKGKIIIEMLNEKCVDNMSGEGFPITINVKVKLGSQNDFKQFTGCGRYLYDYRIYDIWIAVEAWGNKLNKEDYPKGLPRFEFQSDENTLFGHTGCNNIKSSFELRGSKVSFSEIISTKMGCPNYEIEKTILNFISNKTIDYSIDKGYLFLRQNEDNVIVLKKID